MRFPAFLAFYSYTLLFTFNSYYIVFNSVCTIRTIDFYFTSPGLRPADLLMMAITTFKSRVSIPKFLILDSCPFIANGTMNQ